MQTLYYYDPISFYYVGAASGEDLPTENSTDQAPTYTEGYRLKWTGEEWTSGLSPCRNFSIGILVKCTKGIMPSTTNLHLSLDNSPTLTYY
jgi:hypothetical protein